MENDSFLIMLGSGIGKKVTADVVKNEYNEFLEKRNKDVPSKPKNMTKEERRAEMRRRNIFVVADDPEQESSIIERISAHINPFVVKDQSRPLRWKHAGRRKKEKKAPKATGSDHQVSDSNSKPKKKAPKEPTIPATGSETDLDKQKKSQSRSDSEKGSSESDASKKKLTAPEASEKASSETTSSKEKVEPSENVKAPDVVTTTPTSTMTAPLGPPTISPPDDTSLMSLKMSPVSVPSMEKQTDVFEKIDEDDMERIMKMQCAQDEKATIDLARKLLKLAKKLKILDECLTKDDNEVLAKFFSGRMPLNQQVLNVLDVALDKTIDALQKNKMEVDDETKALMKRRDKLKAAIMNEILVSPQYLPRTWTQKYEEWKAEAEKQKHGINWFRVLFTYPKHKSFGDGPEDKFGNFDRKKRGLFLGLLLGPSNSKSFEETKREELSAGMFLDTKIIEAAKADTPKSEMSTIRKSLRKKID
ncbi:unnamed protein product [Caenorhabditis auriculariae]|uniref:DUF7774 domain-containing protein n=1 Tax=Caenorhabditis auriculariae TaxID=2777116 RepID=A0A8S1GTP7_9PELO|nr:unnamed protein product [Caenorhabditis auriculariae]